MVEVEVVRVGPEGLCGTGAGGRSTVEDNGDLPLRGGSAGGRAVVGTVAVSSFFGDLEVARNAARLEPLAFRNQFGFGLTGGLGGRSADERAVSKDAVDAAEETGGAREGWECWAAIGGVEAGGLRVARASKVEGELLELTR